MGAAWWSRQLYRPPSLHSHSLLLFLLSSPHPGSQGKSHGQNSQVSLTWWGLWGLGKWLKKGSSKALGFGLVSTKCRQQFFYDPRNLFFFFPLLLRSSFPLHSILFSSSLFLSLFHPPLFSLVHDTANLFFSRRFSGSVGSQMMTKQGSWCRLLVADARKNLVSDDLLPFPCSLSSSLVLFLFVPLLLLYSPPPLLFFLSLFLSPLPFIPSSSFVFPCERSLL